MNKQSQTVIFGEVLFDCFPSGQQVLGGAPFNVAWHLQALGDSPQFISRIGDDSQGKKIVTAMKDWQMDTTHIQLDSIHPTGRVQVNIINDEPHYDIVTDCAYDFIDGNEINIDIVSGILYHGSLALRNSSSRDAFTQLTKNSGVSIFLDVNLRPPWWQQQDVYRWLQQACWVKLNESELRLLGFTKTNIKQAMTDLQSQFELQQLILTRGALGAIVRTVDGEFHHVIPETELVADFVDTVGAGDAFTAIYIHGLRSNWSISHTLDVAQKFASKVINIQGAISTDPSFYKGFIA